MYDLLVFIGRFQPLHMGHQAVIERALSLSKQVLVLVGSSNSARSTRNPFTYDERTEMIHNLYPSVITRPLHDHTYNDTAWVVEVQNHVKSVLLGEGKFHADGIKDFNVGLIGCAKDHTSYYLKLFPDYESEAVQHVNPLNATAIRAEMFEGRMPERWAQVNVLDPKTYDYIVEWSHTPEFDRLQAEYHYLVDYKQKYGEGPFLTADALVQVGGKILLISSGKEYGHGLLAMPGGFVNKNERFQEAMLRELKEETNLRVPVPVLKGSSKAHRVFDDPHRSERARLITECFHVHLANDTSLPEVRGGDDADEAFWMDIADLRREDFFEDHYHIIKLMLGLN